MNNIVNNTPTAYDLTTWCSVTVQGEQAFQFLQGQLTCDLRDMSPLEARHGALCSIQGRILTLLMVIYHHNQYVLMLPRPLLEATLATLKPVAQLSRVTLVPSEQPLIGLYLPNPSPYKIAAMRSVQPVSIGSDCFILMTDEVSFAHINEQFIQQNAWQNVAAWHTLRLQQGHFQIYPHTRGQFLPHHLGLHRTGHISFNKGCYRGQEIIARMHYKSTSKYEPKSFTLPAHIGPIEPGQKVFHPTEDRSIGEIIDCCPLADDQLFLVCSLLKDNHEFTLTRL